MTHHISLSLCLLLVACAGSESAHRSDEPADDAPPEAPAEAETASGEDERTRAIQTAEAFVRAQGYTDVPPTVPEDEIVPESIEGTVAMRLNQIEARAVSASGQGSEWMVIFRYRDPRYEGRGRAVRLSAGEAPNLAHQDVILSAWE